MKILLLGAAGMLGTDMAIALADREYVTASTNELDYRDLKSVTNYLEKLNPEIVINCRGYTNVDACETDIKSAYEINAIGPRNLAVVCNKLSIGLVHISTDYIFDGEAGRPYLEDDFPNPLGVYGKSKLSGENFIRTLTNKHFIIRTQWIYGKNGKNFVKTMLNMAEEGNKLRVVDDQFGSPTSTKDLAAAIALLIDTEAYGVYHITNSGSCSWYEFAKDIFEISGINPEIEPCPTEGYPRPARRPKYSVLCNNNWELSGFAPLRNYREALRDYLYS